MSLSGKRWDWKTRGPKNIASFLWREQRSSLPEDEVGVHVFSKFVLRASHGLEKRYMINTQHVRISEYRREFFPPWSLGRIDV